MNVKMVSMLFYLGALPLFAAPAASTTPRDAVNAIANSAVDSAVTSLKDVLLKPVEERKKRDAERKAALDAKVDSAVKSVLNPVIQPLEELNAAAEKAKVRTEEQKKLREERAKSLKEAQKARQERRESLRKAFTPKK